jgi:hypothetical protein
MPRTRAAGAPIGVVALLLACLSTATRAADIDGGDFIYRAKQGDTLIGLSQRLLARPGDWPTIQRLNAIREPRRIPIGTEIRIPFALLRAESIDASVVQAVGQARVLRAGGAAEALAPGASVRAGERIATGTDGYVTIQLADGTLLRVQAATEAQLETSRRYPSVGFFASAWRLVRGRVDTLVTQLTGGAPQFEVRTPQGVLGVRGTEFRAAADVERNETRGEVLSGTVTAAGKSGSQSISAGFATTIDARGEVAAPVALLPAPDLSALPALQEKVLVRFTAPSVPGAAGYRAQVSRDAEFQLIVGESRIESGDLRFADLDDGDYFLRVRAIDARGLEGADAVHRFRLQARPEPPLPTAPAPGERRAAADIELAWTRNPAAARYRLQLARDAAFAQPLRDETVAATQLVLRDLAPGVYHWRLASVRGERDQGPWGDPLQFDLRALPAPLAAPKVGAHDVRLSWSGLPGQRFDVELARDREFEQIVAADTVGDTSAVLPHPGPGTYYVRYRAIDPDGFVGPYSAPQSLVLEAQCLVDGTGRCVGAAGGGFVRPQ